MTTLGIRQAPSRMNFVSAWLISIIVTITTCSTPNSGESSEYLTNFLDPYLNRYESEEVVRRPSSGSEVLEFEALSKTKKTPLTIIVASDLGRNRRKRRRDDKALEEKLRQLTSEEVDTKKNNFKRFSFNDETYFDNSNKIPNTIRKKERALYDDSRHRYQPTVYRKNKNKHDFDTREEDHSPSRKHWLQYTRESIKRRPDKQIFRERSRKRILSSYLNSPEDLSEQKINNENQVFTQNEPVSVEIRNEKGFPGSSEESIEDDKKLTEYNDKKLSGETEEQPYVDAKSISQKIISKENKSPRKSSQNFQESAEVGLENQNRKISQPEQSREVDRMPELRDINEINSEIAKSGELTVISDIESRLRESAKGEKFKDTKELFSSTQVEQLPEKLENMNYFRDSAEKTKSKLNKSAVYPAKEINIRVLHSDTVKNNKLEKISIENSYSEGSTKYPEIELINDEEIHSEQSGDYDYVSRNFFDTTKNESSAEIIYQLSSTNRLNFEINKSLDKMNKNESHSNENAESKLSDEWNYNKTENNKLLILIEKENQLNSEEFVRIAETNYKEKQYKVSTEEVDLTKENHGEDEKILDLLEFKEKGVLHQSEESSNKSENENLSQQTEENNDDLQLKGEKGKHSDTEQNSVLTENDNNNQKTKIDVSKDLTYINTAEDNKSAVKQSKQSTIVEIKNTFSGRIGVSDAERDEKSTEKVNSDKNFKIKSEDETFNSETIENFEETEIKNQISDLSQKSEENKIEKNIEVMRNNLKKQAKRDNSAEVTEDLVPLKQNSKENFDKKGFNYSTLLPNIHDKGVLFERHLVLKPELDEISSVEEDKIEEDDSESQEDADVLKWNPASKSNKPRKKKKCKNKLTDTSKTYSLSFLFNK